MREVWVFRFKFVDGIVSAFKSRLTADGSVNAGQRGTAHSESHVGCANVGCIRRMDVLAT